MNGDPTADPFQSDEQRAYVHALEDVEVARKALVRKFRDLDPSIDEWKRRADWLVAVWREGLGYRAGAAHGIGLDLSRIRESRGSLVAELTASRDGLPLVQEVANLSSGSARTALAKRLSLHPFGATDHNGKSIDWREILEQFCMRVLALERAGEDFERVGQRPQQSTPARVVDPFLPLAPTLIWAPQGVGKSTFAAAVAVSLEAYAEVIPGWHPVDQCRCLVLDWEASPTEWNDRIQRIAAGIQADPPDVLYLRPRRPLVDQVEAIAAIVDRERIGYLVVDSVEKAAGARSEGSTYEEKAERLFLAIDRIGIPALLIDHVAGDDLRHGQSRVVPKSIGSVLKGAWARATYDLKRDPDTSTDGTVQMLLTNVKMSDGRRLPPYAFAIRYDGDEHTGPIRFERGQLDNPEWIATMPLVDRVRLFLAKEGAMATAAIAEAVGSTPGSIRDLYSKDARRSRPRFVRLPDGSIGIRQHDEGFDDE